MNEHETIRAALKNRATAEETIVAIAALDTIEAREREPSDEEFAAIAASVDSDFRPYDSHVAMGRAMWQAVKKWQDGK